MNETTDGSSQAQGPILLSGGNPQIPKGEGEAAVKAYIAAMPGWRSDVGRRMDALIEQAAPGVRKAVKWNSPFYGADVEGWFLSFHVFTKYIKVTFFRGAGRDAVHELGQAGEPAAGRADVKGLAERIGEAGSRQDQTEVRRAGVA